MVTINGKNCDCNGMTVADYLIENGYKTEYVAVELNGEILPRANYTNTVLSDGDKLEVVSFVGGG